MRGSANAEGRMWLGGQDPLKSYVNACGGKQAVRRILVASNGMAAAKVMMSMRQWAHMEANLGSSGILEFVAMATKDDLDANAEFIRLADKHVEVPPGKNVNNYANVDLICKIAQAQKVDAVWPGWGHASENPKLPAKLKPGDRRSAATRVARGPSAAKDLGIHFIGPTSPVMSVLGDKIAAGILAQTAGVPSIPWSGDGLTAELTAEGTIPEETFKKACLTSVQQAVACAERIGFPVMLKASEGVRKLDVVFYAAVLRAVRQFEARDVDFAEAIAKRRLGLLHQVGSSTVNLEIAFEGHKFQFCVRRLAADAYDFAVAGAKITAQVRVQPDGSLLVSVDGSVMKVSGSEEALGLRLRLQGVGTVLLPTIFDPSELRSDFNGKVLRYLVPEGEVVKKGQAYVELEAMTHGCGIH
eukprot:g27628.t1